MPADRKAATVDHLSWPTITQKIKTLALNSMYEGKQVQQR